MTTVNVEKELFDRLRGFVDDALEAAGYTAADRDVLASAAAELHTLTAQRNEILERIGLPFGRLMRAVHALPGEIADIGSETAAFITDETADALGQMENDQYQAVTQMNAETDSRAVR
jgi:hypothetical protein